MLAHSHENRDKHSLGSQSCERVMLTMETLPYLIIIIIIIIIITLFFKTSFKLLLLLLLLLQTLVALAISKVTENEYSI